MDNYLLVYFKLIIFDYYIEDIEPTNEINSFCKIKGSGLFLVA